MIFPHGFKQILKWVTGSDNFSLSQELVLIEDRKNSLLGRREVKALFRGAAGKLKKTEAADQIAGQLGVDKKTVIPINLFCETGMTDIHATFYVYESDEVAKKQLSEAQLANRTLDRIERKLAPAASDVETVGI